MKASALSLLLLLGMAACSGETTSIPKGSESPVRTERGVPAGAATYATFDAAGGSLESIDGRLLVRVPAGAVEQTTQFRIQPITNLAPGSRGPGYRITPHGFAFAAPVEVVFQYDASDLEGTSAAMLQVAWQDDAGHWVRHGTPVLDEAAGTLTVETTHFSDWSLVAGYQLFPGQATIRAGQSVALRLDFCGAGEEEGQLLLHPCRPATDADFEALDSWQVNGQPGGGGQVGTITPDGTLAATYRAPRQAPAANPVAVSARLLAGLHHTLLVSHVLVIQDDCGSWRGKPVACTLAGTTTERSVVNEAVTEARAEVVFELDELTDGTAWYRPLSGTATSVRHQVWQGRDAGNEWVICSIEYAPSNWPIADDEFSSTSYLAVDYDSDPPTLLDGTGYTSWAAAETIVCPDGTHVNDEAEGIAAWLSAYEPTPATAEGGVFEGSYVSSDGSLSSTWRFERR